MLVVDSVVQQEGHEGPAVGSVPLGHSELLVHLLKLQQLRGRAQVAMVTLCSALCADQACSPAHTMLRRARSISALRSFSQQKCL